MEKYLARLCTERKIQLQYIDDDSLMLTCSIRNNSPTIIVNRLFSNCPQIVADAIFSYCTGNEGSELYYDVIEEYAKENLYSLEYIIEPPTDSFKSLLKRSSEKVVTEVTPQVRKEAPPKKMARQTKAKEITAGDDIVIGKLPLEDTETALYEVNISSITSRDFYGNTSNIKPGETIKPSSDNIMELDIMVDNPDKNNT